MVPGGPRAVHQPGHLTPEGIDHGQADGRRGGERVRHRDYAPRGVGEGRSQRGRRGKGDARLIGHRVGEGVRPQPEVAPGSQPGGTQAGAVERRVVRCPGGVRARAMDHHQLVGCEHALDPVHVEADVVRDALEAVGAERPVAVPGDRVGAELRSGGRAGLRVEWARDGRDGGAVARCVERTAGRSSPQPVLGHLHVDAHVGQDRAGLPLGHVHLGGVAGPRDADAVAEGARGAVGGCRGEGEREVLIQWGGARREARHRDLDASSRDRGATDEQALGVPSVAAGGREHVHVAGCVARGAEAGAVLGPDGREHGRRRGGVRRVLQLTVEQEE